MAELAALAITQVGRQRGARAGDLFGRRRIECAVFDFAFADAGDPNASVGCNGVGPGS